jgi:hypothetical protein
LIHERSKNDFYTPKCKYPVDICRGDGGWVDERCAFMVARGVGSGTFPIRKMERTCSYLSGITFEGEILGDYMRQRGGVAVMPHPVRLTERPLVYSDHQRVIPV